MKNIVLFLLGILLSSAVEAQTDTLFNFFNIHGAGLIESPNGGYVSGSNGYKDSEKLQSFFPVGFYSILGVLSWNGHVAATQSESEVCFFVKQLDTTATSVFPFYVGPTQTLDSVFVPLSNLTETTSFPETLQYIAFNQPVLVTGPYLVGFNLDSLAKDESGFFIDSFAVATSADDSTVQAGYSWEKWNGIYKRIVDSWGLNVDLAMFPVIDLSLDGNETIQNTEVLSVFPNPAEGQISFQTGLNHEAANLTMFSIDGKIVMQMPLFLEKNTQSIQLPNVDAGLYFISIKTSETRFYAPLFCR